MTRAVNAPRKNGRGGTSRVKSGCRTCKIRKVKCDEHFPVCQRCVSTGRICDGYGVWGGGGNDYGSRQPPRAPSDTSTIMDYHPLTRISTLVASTDEKASFQWFRVRTLTKIPGSYISDFWTTILLQAGHTDQAAWHAILALSSTHQRGFVHTNPGPENMLEHSTSRNLIKAVHHLHSHFSSQDKLSCRVVLIVCLVFVVLDLLRGHFTSAQVHLRNGLNILAKTNYSSQVSNSDSHGSPPTVCEPIDVSIYEAFFRIHTQVELLQHHHNPRPCIIPPLQLSVYEPCFSASQFSSYTAAWRGLDYLINQIFLLSAQAREHAANAGAEATSSYTLLAHQQRIKIGLDSWLATYTSSVDTLRLAVSETIAEAKTKVHHVVCSYHIMLTIMAETALTLNNETIFDSYTARFTEMISRLTAVRKSSSTEQHLPNSQLPPDDDKISVTGEAKRRRIGGCDMAHTIIDIGWMIPLFYVAIKCRVRSIRHQAIRLLESTSHREGIWDATITARIARRVVEIEEGDFYDDIGSETEAVHDPDRNLGSAARNDGAMLSESCRIRHLEVRMEGDPLEKVFLFGGWEGMSGSTVCIGEYRVLGQCWI
ncbi:uncharacterized protein BJX67DRAFT_280640 [Aspergillus lucknowensis]|uniref:Zn(2)-C6 fungal-type domain-containing protein n=1 Tax=Aspergillus lucknowensis TaxID=176173 RepID=A0ABR4M0J6_9EURO